MMKKSLLLLSCLCGSILLIFVMSSCDAPGINSNNCIGLTVTCTLNSTNLTNYADLSIPSLQVKQNITPQMIIHHSYVVKLSLRSSQTGAKLSALEGSVIDGQMAPLSTLLGSNNIPCAAASLFVDPAAFDVEPSQPQEYSLQESQITWTWSVTPLQLQESSTHIPVVVNPTSCATRW